MLLCLPFQVEKEGQKVAFLFLVLFCFPAWGEDVLDYTGCILEAMFPSFKKFLLSGKYSRKSGHFFPSLKTLGVVTSKVY